MRVLQPTFLTIDKLTRAPELPGIYCWLAKPNLSLFLSRGSEFENDSSALEALVDELAGLMHASKDQDLDCLLEGYFGSRWSGTVTSEVPMRRKDTPSEKTRRDCRGHNHRRLLSRIIEASFPVFWQPLYIGVAVNLRNRLNTHQRAIRQAFDEGASSLEQFELQEEFKEAATLAKRISICRYRAEHLVIAILPIEHLAEEASAKEIRTVAEVAEAWLNRFSTPRLGRL